MIDNLRRQLLLGLPVLAGGVAVVDAAGNRSAAIRPESVFKGPRETLHALAKVLGSMDGNPCYHWLGGRIFDKRDAAPLAEPMLDWEGCTIRRFAWEGPDRLRMTYRGIILFKAVDGSVIDEFRSPAGDGSTPVAHFRTALGAYTFTSNGIEASPRFKGRLGTNPNPFALPWIAAGDDVWLTLDERVEYTRPGTNIVIADNAVFRFQSRLSEIADANRAMASANISYHSEIPYYDWMGMAGVSGHTLWGAAGKKYAGLDSLPERFVEAVIRRYPTHFSDPLT